MTTKAAKRPAPAPSLWATLSGEADALAHLAGSVFIGIRDQRHFDEIEAEVAAICVRLRAAVRGAR